MYFFCLIYWRQLNCYIVVIVLRVLGISFSLPIVTETLILEHEGHWGIIDDGSIVHWLDFRRQHQLKGGVEVVLGKKIVTLIIFHGSEIISVGNWNNCNQ
jgi:hypothetical protein